MKFLFEMVSCRGHFRFRFFWLNMFADSIHSHHQGHEPRLVPGLIRCSYDFRLLKNKTWRREMKLDTHAHPSPCFASHFFFGRKTRQVSWGDRFIEPPKKNLENNSMFQRLHLHESTMSSNKRTWINWLCWIKTKSLDLFFGWFFTGFREARRSSSNLLGTSSPFHKTKSNFRL